MIFFLHKKKKGETIQAFVSTNQQIKFHDFQISISI